VFLGDIIGMKMNKKKAIAIITQVYDDILETGNVIMHWDAEKMLRTASEKPASFFKEDENAEFFVDLLGVLHDEGKLLDVQ